MMPELKIRYVNVSEISGVSVGDYSNRSTPKSLSHKEFVKFFTEDKPIVFNYHGYKNDIEQIFWDFADPTRFTIHAYSEEGSTTTPFDMAIRNKVSRYHLAINMVEKASLKNKAVAKKKDAFVKLLNKKSVIIINILLNLVTILKKLKTSNGKKILILGGGFAA